MKIIETKFTSDSTSPSNFIDLFQVTTSIFRAGPSARVVNYEIQVRNIESDVARL